MRRIRAERVVMLKEKNVKSLQTTDRQSSIYTDFKVPRYREMTAKSIFWRRFLTWRCSPLYRYHDVDDDDNKSRLGTTLLDVTLGFQSSIQNIAPQDGLPSLLLTRPFSAQGAGELSRFESLIWFHPIFVSVSTASCPDGPQTVGRIAVRYEWETIPCYGIQSSPVPCPVFPSDLQPAQRMRILVMPALPAMYCGPHNTRHWAPISRRIASVDAWTVLAAAAAR